MAKIRNEFGVFVKTGLYIECLTCGKLIYTKRCNKDKTKFCRRECYRLSKIGTKQSAETIKRKIASNTGKKRSEETKQKLRIKKIGKLNPSWAGGRSVEKYGEGWTTDLRDNIRKRDKYTCQECGMRQDELVGMHKKLSVHHIDYNKHNLNPSNLITLCESCHAKTNFKRKDWIEHFYKRHME